MTALTESEAQERWCPFARAAHWNAPTGGNRLMRNDGPSDVSPVALVCRCIASGCMAWRWDVMAGDTDTDGNVTFAEYDKGWCGLAGRPE